MEKILYENIITVIIAQLYKVFLEHGNIRRTFHTLQLEKMLFLEKFFDKKKANTAPNNLRIQRLW